VGNVCSGACTVHDCSNPLDHFLVAHRRPLQEIGRLLQQFFNGSDQAFFHHNQVFHIFGYRPTRGLRAVEKLIG
jgi:hypothetical protein